MPVIAVGRRGSENLYLPSLEVDEHPVDGRARRCVDPCLAATLDSWPSLASHMSDSAPQPLALAPPRNTVTYAIVTGNFLGGSDYFLLSSTTPRDAASWSRPKLIGPTPHDIDEGKATLAWRGSRTLVLNIAGQTLQIAIDEIERDSDGDGWTDLEEARIGTNPHAVDSDDDGIPDGRDVCPLYAPPRDRDESAEILQTAISAASR